MKIQYGADGSAQDVSTTFPLPVATQTTVGQVDSNNTTTTPLAGGATFTGTGTDILDFAAITITLYADVDSAASGMTFQFSTDNTNWDDVYSFTMDVSESDTRRFQFPTTAQYFRVVYTNGAGAQSAFRVQTIAHPTNQLTSIHRLGDDLSADRSATVTKASTFGEAADGLFKAVALSDNNELRTTNHADDAGGCDIFRSLDVDVTEEQVKGTAGNLYWLNGFNSANQARYLKIYNDTAANVVVGTTTPVLTIPLTKEVAFEFSITQGLYLDTAITIAATTGMEDASVGDPSAGDVVCNIGYK